MAALFRYSVKRLLQSLITLFIVTSLAFLMLRLMPLEGYFPQGTFMKMSDTAKMAQLQKLGLYGSDKQPISPFIQLITYYKNLLTSLDFGVSTQLYPNLSVGPIIAEKMQISMLIGMSALIISLVSGFTLGISMARHKNGIVDTVGMVYIVLANSIVPVVIYIFVQFYLTKWLHTSMIYRAGNPMTYITPIIATSLVPLANNALWIRRYMVDELNKDYIKLAYAKGLPTKTVFFRHILRNAFIPMAYSLPSSVLFTLTGAIIMERLFSVPGMGRLYLDAINRRDNNFVQALVLIYAALGIAGVFSGDILAVIVDPRIKLSKKGGTR